MTTDERVLKKLKVTGYELLEALLIAKDKEIKRLQDLLTSKTTPGYELLTKTIIEKDQEIESLKRIISSIGKS